MLQDHEFFASLCEKRGISFIRDISEAIKVSSITGELRLSSLSIMIPVCEMIARTLVSSRTIRIVDLSDCMLVSKGLACIFEALCEGTAVTTLNLKGNNVNGSIVAKLGRVLACNNTLKRLHIEWNNVGTDADSFATFCDGLARNHNVEHLDLRYNQVSSRCIEHLCETIRRNKSLRSIDLSWNTLGQRDGQRLLNAMRENKTITDLVLRGNCISGSIAFAIDERLRKNRCVRATTEYVLNADAEIVKHPTMATKDFTGSTGSGEMSLESARVQKVPIRRQKESDKRQNPRALANIAEINDGLNLSIETNAEVNARFEDKVESRVTISSRDRDLRITETDAKIADLTKMLRERTAAIDLLTSEITTKAAEMNDTRTQLNLLRTQIDQLQEDKKKCDLEKTREIAEFRKSHDEAEENWQRIYKDLKDNYNDCSRRKEEAEIKVRRYEREIHENSLAIGVLRDKLASTIRAYEDLLSKNKTKMHRSKRVSKERDNKHRIELNFLKSTLEETTRAHEDCQVELQKSRRETRDLSKNQVSLKTKLDDAERKMFRYTKLEENYRKVEEERNILQEKFADSRRIVSSLQRQIVNLQNELIEPQRQHDLLKQELGLEKETNERLKREFREESARLKNQNLQIKRLNQEIAILNARLDEVQAIHAEALHERERERKQLQDIISSKERNLSELRAEELQRAGQLYTAFNKYLSSIGPNPIS